MLTPLITRVKECLVGNLSERLWHYVKQILPGLVHQAVLTTTCTQLCHCIQSSSPPPSSSSPSLPSPSHPPISQTVYLAVYSLPGCIGFTWLSSAVPVTKTSMAFDTSARFTPLLNFIDNTRGCCLSHLQYTSLSQVI